MLTLRAVGPVVHGGRPLASAWWQALLRTFACEAVEDVELRGRDPTALGDLVVHQHSQGPLSHYRLNEIDPNPLDRKRRRAEDGAAAAGALAAADAAASGLPTGVAVAALAPSSVVVEDQENHRTLARNVRAQFGTNPLPALDAVRLDVRSSHGARQVGLQLIVPG